MSRRRSCLVWAAFALSCASKPSAIETSTAELDASGSTANETPTQTSTGTVDPASSSSAPPPPRYDDPRISTSRGETGGIVVLWPRIIPASSVEGSDAIAASLQSHLRVMVEKAYPDKSLDVRPSPQRTCPKAGCEGTAVGVLLIRREDVCVTVAFVMPPGSDRPTSLVPWSGRIELARASIAFRQPPEAEVKILDYGACGELPGAMSAHDDAVLAAVRAVAG
jgi:hypothetical protein